MASGSEESDTQEAGDVRAWTTVNGRPTSGLSSSDSEQVSYATYGCETAEE
ncbi:hypothetical protein MA16_Dca015549 [Dendrobium catenatum]|uniref:Uncharacterized protein n=1 Tax=Dendrobium catenatum TaxID=906689 RepID=A0A2I0WKP5_9ASPA|nr:hypothetical protein MA16_Dca015549 [Dendrobium catenatum]